MCAADLSGERNVGKLLKLSMKIDLYAEPGIKGNFRQWDRWKDRTM